MNDEHLPAAPTSTVAADDLRIAVALAHRVPGAQLVCGLPSGGSVSVGRHPANDIEPCVMRRVTIEGGVGPVADPRTWVAGLRLEGTVAAAGGAVFTERGNRGVQWWVATTLPCTTALAAMRDDGRLGAYDQVTARVQPDEDLGVCLIEFSGRETALNDGRSRGRSDAETAARTTASVLMVEELLSASRSDIERSR